MDLAASLLARESASGSVDALVEAMKVRTDRIGTISVLFWFFFRVASVRLADFRFPRPRPRRKNDEDDSRRARVSVMITSSCVRILTRLLLVEFRVETSSSAAFLLRNANAAADRLRHSFCSFFGGSIFLFQTNLSLSRTC